MSPNFDVSGSGTAVVAGVASTRMGVPNAVRDVMVFNPGPLTVRVKTGDSAVVANATSMPVLAGEKGAYDVGFGQRWLALCCPEGDQAVEVFFGEGS